MICLTMIVKNESAVIERCLKSVLPFIDCWAIVDTGSTDDTKEIVERVMHGARKPGYLESMKWVDFSTCRNKTLDIARNALSALHPDDYNSVYAFTIDADEVFKGEIPCPIDPAYYIDLSYGNTTYKRLALFRLFSDFTWVGPVHEALMSKNYPGPYPTLPGAVVEVINDGASSKLPAKEKYLEHARLLEKALEKEPDNARYQFYLAQSYKDAGMLGDAYSAYKKRIDMHGWGEEVYYSWLQIGKILEIQHNYSMSPLDIYQKAIECRPQRAEAWYEAARYLRLKGMYQNAYIYAKMAWWCTLKPTDDILFVDKSVYDWRAVDETAVSAYWCGEKDVCKQRCEELLGLGKYALQNKTKLPESERARVEKNLEFCK